MEHHKKFNAIITASLLMAVLASCGYHITPVGGIVPLSSKSIAIPVFVNNTFEPNVDIDVTNAVVEEFLTDGRLKVVGPEAADIVLRGKVTKFEATPQTYSIAPYVLSYSVAITVNITVIDAKTDKVLLQDSSVGSIFNSTYAVTLGDISQTKIAKSAAIKNTCRDLASTLRSRVLDGF